MSLNLKLVRGNEIRKAYLVPQNIPELFACVDSVFGSTDFNITYLDAEGDHVTISTQQDLEAAYQAAHMEGRLALKFFMEKKTTTDYIKESARQVESEDEDFVVLEMKQELPVPELEVHSEAVEVAPVPEVLAEVLTEVVAEPVETVPVNEVEQPMPEEEQKKPVCKRGLKRAMKDAAKQFKQAFKPMCKRFKEFKGCKPRIVNPQGALFSQEQIEFIRNIVREETGQSKVVHSRFTCDGCGVHPIVGVRYNCTVCHDFDFCENCEAQTEHAHPFIKHKSVVVPRPAAPSNEVVIDLDLGNVLPFVPAQVQAIVNELQAKLQNRFKPKVSGLKGKVEAHLTLTKFTEVKPETEYVKTWVVLNKGKVAWPVGTKLVKKGGRIAALNEVELPPLAPGETFEVSVNVAMPKRCGKAKGVWRFETPDGQMFGVAKCVVIITRPEAVPEMVMEETQDTQVTETSEFVPTEVILAEPIQVSAPAAPVAPVEEMPREVKALVNMGFSEEQSREALMRAQNDVNLAVSMLFRA
jgi:hypothetical protein